MPFTDRFIKVPVRILNAELSDLTGKSENTISDIYVDPFQIAYYEPASFEEGNELIDVGLKNGESFNVCLSVEEFQKLLNDHYAESR